MQKSRRPADTPFKQQKLKAWQPILTPSYVIGSFLLLGALFIPIGVVLKGQSDGVVEYSQQYDGAGSIHTECGITEANTNQECTIDFTANQKMEEPVYVYYELSNFYQNHRRYVKSISYKQLQGKTDSADVSFTDDCQPLQYITKPDTTNPDTSKQILLSPCGLIANSLFNDVISTTTESIAAGFGMKEEGIAWESDVEEKYLQPDGFKYEECFDTVGDSNCSTLCNQEGWCGTAKEPYVDADSKKYAFFYPDDINIQYLYESYPEVVSPIEGVKNEHFIVWMRTAGLPKFRKLYGIIEKDIEKGETVSFTIKANFDVMRFGGTKSLVISTTSFFGGKNPFLGWSYIVVGGVCILLGAAFGAKHMMNPRRLGDTRYLVWKEA